MRHSRKATTVKGHYRSGKWVSAHQRASTTVATREYRSYQPILHSYLSNWVNNDGRKSFTQISDARVPPEMLGSTEKMDVCGETTCSHCGKRVYFLRYNGGAIWLDAMGWPWPKHSCFDLNEPSWIFYFRKHTRSSEAPEIVLPDMSILVGVAVRVVSVPRIPRALIAFDGGSGRRFCLEVVTHTNIMPKNGFMGALDLRSLVLTLSTFQRYPVISLDISPADLGLEIDWTTN